MELTPKAFRDVQFREKLRGGYHPEDVDEFLEQAALALEALLEQFRQATERAQRAEQAASEATATDEALKRMLLIAQRTADQAVSEAREEADQLLTKSRDEADKLSTKARDDAHQLSTQARDEADQLSTNARDEADRLLTEAQAQAAATLADAQERGRRAYESDLAAARASMEKADEAVRSASQEVESLRDWVDTHKAHLLGVLRDAHDRVEKAGLLSEPPPTRFGAGSGPDGASEVQADMQAEGESPPAATTTGDDGPVPEGGLIDSSEDQTAEWDPHSLEGFEATGGDGQAVAAAPPPPLAPSDIHPAPADESAPATAVVDSVAVGAAEVDVVSEVDVVPDVDVTDANAPAVAADGQEPEAQADAAAQPGPGDTMAFDERALDSFFSDQDLGQKQGGFFRRRQ